MCDVLPRRRHLETFRGPVGVRLGPPIGHTIMDFAFRTGYDIDSVREEKEFRSLVTDTFIIL